VCASRSVVQSRDVPAIGASFFLSRHAVDAALGELEDGWVEVQDDFYGGVFKPRLCGWVQMRHSSTP